MGVLFIQYFILSFVVILASIKISECVDEIDQQTNLGGAIIGGVLLAGVTSLPELITSLSSTIMLENPDLAFGNILGSNAFNTFVLAVGNILFLRHRLFNKVTAANTRTCIVVILIYMLILISFQRVANVSFMHVGAPSIIIFMLYYVNLKSTPTIEDQSVDSIQVSKKDRLWTGFRFIFWGIIIVGASLLVSITTNKIAQATGVGSSFIGAIFLGIATSLPETTSLISLVKLRNYDMAVGNIVGSNLFNFGILALTDFLYFSGNIFDIADESNAFLATIGTIQAMIVAFILLRGKIKNKISYILPSIFIVLTYCFYIYSSIQ